MFCFIVECLAWLFYLVNLIACPLGWLVLILSSTRATIGPAKFNQFRSRLFALRNNKVQTTEIMKGLRSTKLELFSPMKEMKSSDPDMRKKNVINILEVGAGTGTNFEFFPAGSRLTCVDPNAQFGSFMQRAVRENATHLDPDIKFVASRGEDMAAVPDASMDAVVVTHVLCSVEHQDTFMREIRRVLVPGGKFFFLEHVGGEQGTWRRCIQNIYSDSGLWPTLFGGCTVNRDTLKAIMAADFALVDCKTVVLKDVKLYIGRSSTTPKEGFIINPFLVGTATK